jgi:hypothetical protein
LGSGENGVKLGCLLSVWQSLLATPRRSPRGSAEFRVALPGYPAVLLCGVKRIFQQSGKPELCNRSDFVMIIPRLGVLSHGWGLFQFIGASNALVSVIWNTGAELGRALKKE